MWVTIHTKCGAKYMLRLQNKHTHWMDGIFWEIANIKPILFSILEYYFPIFLYGFWHMTYFKFHQNGCVMYIFWDQFSTSIRLQKMLLFISSILHSDKFIECNHHIKRILNTDTSIMIIPPQCRKSLHNPI